MAQSPDVRGFFDPATHTVTYLVSDPATRQAAIIDPVLDFDAPSARTSTRSIDAVMAALRSEGLKLALVLETHAHADHLTAAAHLRAATGVSIGIGGRITQVQSAFGPLFGAEDVRPDGAVFDHLYADGDAFALGDLTVEVIHTPGHTPACVSYRIGDAVFTGDTLFMPDYGTARTDFPGGDARTLYRSIQRLLTLPNETRIFVGHDYLPEGRTDFRFETTVAEQRAQNIHIGGGVSEDAFVAMREARDATLGAPQLILPSLQVNIRAGDLPPPDANGQRYLRLPLNAI
ncbi:Probable polyketide biosynthesis zinc-dependent hydrolase BaeB [Brevundimonas vesicularis]|uniref:Probable polyketide biosynthesis zinc-dependent hydrolase BaeB n=1 Tax=Brevundimonas vesicularis TaxID=41276 RepID=A0A2X1BGV0_BREVE|nr:MBL fold metallo-hydrolase [Brevundimonas vesicularis]SPU51812.1 Probable polyketide biosynthesis zinc-dependent hydrolase BaeB [Brevundimonas vesicularis]